MPRANPTQNIIKKTIKVKLKIDNGLFWNKLIDQRKIPF